MSENMQITKPVVGDIVHFIGADNTHWPAIVHIVKGPGIIDVVALLRHSVSFEHNVHYCEPNRTRQEGDTLLMEPAPPRTWHWIEDEPGEPQAEQVEPLTDVTAPYPERYFAPPAAEPVNEEDASHD